MYDRNRTQMAVKMKGSWMCKVISQTYHSSKDRFFFFFLLFSMRELPGKIQLWRRIMMNKNECSYQKVSFQDSFTFCTLNHAVSFSFNFTQSYIQDQFHPRFRLSQQFYHKSKGKTKQKLRQNSKRLLQKRFFFFF